MSTVASGSTGTRGSKALDASVKALTRMLEEPTKRTTCASKLHAASLPIQTAIHSCPTVAAQVKLAKSWPRLLRAGIKFLTRKQTSAQYSAMVENLAQCRCNLDQPGMRELHSPASFDPSLRSSELTQLTNMMHLRLSIHTIIDCIQLALYGQTKHKFRSEKSTTTPGEDQPWPQDPDDLLPFGPEDSIDGIELWAEGPGGYYMYKLATSLALYYHPFSKAMVRPPDYTFAMVRASKHLTGVMDFYDEDPSCADAQDLFEWPITVIFDYFQLLVNHDNFHAMMKTHGKTISPVLARLSKILAALPAKDWITDTRVGIEILSSFANDDLAGMSKRTAPIANTIRDPVYDAFAELAMVRKGGCSNMTCPNTSGTVYARLCSQCNVMRFCGEHCQKEAWKNPFFPHKIVCSKIAKLKEQLGKKAWAQLWIEDMTTAKYLALPKKPMDTKNVEEIGRVLTDVKAFKMALSDDAPWPSR